MPTEHDLAAARRAFAEELRATSPVLKNESVVDAFATVPRERFLGPGPWTILPGARWGESYETPDTDPRRVYHDVLVPLDAARDINNGQPSLWAYMFDRLAIRPGERVYQVGAGTGYYTALFAELVGANGHVTAVEYDAGLAAQAAANTASWSQIDLIHGDGATFDPGEVDLVVAFAGVTHPLPLWLDRLAVGGRLMVGLTGPSMWGFMLMATRLDDGFRAEALGPAGFIPFVGRDEEAGERLARALKRLKGKPVPIKSLHRGAPPEGNERKVWYWGPGFWLSR
ncbi:MAG: methyltransferase domain-containing protein [Pseudomonadota bacterium]